MKCLSEKKLLIILLNILLLLVIVKLCKITGFCLTLLNLISPLFFGYVLAWIIRPVIEWLKKRGINRVFGNIIIYVFLIGLIIVIGVTLIPRIMKDLNNLLPSLVDFINNNKYLSKLKSLVLNKELSSNLMGTLNNSFKSIFNSCATIIYSFIISFFLSVNNIKINDKFLTFIPNKLLNKINKNLRIYVKGTFIDMFILFIMASIAFGFAKLPSFLLFAFLVALTNVIPYIGPYIGGIPAVLVGFSLSSKMGIIILAIVVGLQIIEGSFIQPYIMSKSLKLSPIFIIMGLIIFSHFLGIVGMLISTPVVSILKILYDYYKKNKPEWFTQLLDRL